MGGRLNTISSKGHRSSFQRPAVTAAAAAAARESRIIHLLPANDMVGIRKSRQGAQRRADVWCQEVGGHVIREICHCLPSCDSDDA